MPEICQKAVEIYCSEGIKELLLRGTKFSYSHLLRQHLPRKIARYNEQRVLAARLFDSVVPWEHTYRPNYESGLARGLRNNVQEGDKAVIIGGGWGVTTAIAAKQVGKTGQVTVFEGATDCIANIEGTLDLNNVSDRVEIRHAIVGPEIRLRGTKGEAAHIGPDDLPDCDVLELDCEGAEVEILKNMSIRPRTILVETHGMYDAPTKKVQELLASLSYKIVDERVADAGLEEQCIENDIQVLVANKAE